ncbi:MAG: flagellar biosynthesis protein FlhB [Alphaproteobacteria bacterium]
MAEDDDDSQKTEEPSERRLEEAKEKGQGYNSREVGHFLMLLILTASIGIFAPRIFRDLTYYLSTFLENSHQIKVDEGNLSRVLISSFTNGYLVILVPIIATIIGGVIGNYIQHGEFRVSAEPLIPKMDKISLIKGFGKIFSMNSLVEFVKNIIKLILIGVVCYLSIAPNLKHLKLLHEYSIASFMSFLFNITNNMLVKVCIVMGFLAAVDYVYQRFAFYKSMRMSKQDLKDEYKQTEGSPEVKARLRGLRLEKSRKRMMSEVPKADVVITNPTHFAVALKYELGSMAAPTVIAKGKDLIALKIREIAQKNKIPVIENPPLARLLFKVVDIDKEIPVEHYKAVAEVINYVYRLKKKLK